MFYLNVYLVHQCYGGPEEGGWWYNAGEPEASVPLTSEDFVTAPYLPYPETPDFDPRDPEERFYDSKLTPAGEAKRAALEAQFAEYAWGKLSSAAGGQAVQVVFEPHFARDWPERRPHYE